MGAYFRDHQLGHAACVCEWCIEDAHAQCRCLRSSVVPSSGRDGHRRARQAGGRYRRGTGRHAATGRVLGIVCRSTWTSRHVYRYVCRHVSLLVLCVLPAGRLGPSRCRSTPHLAVAFQRSSPEMSVRIWYVAGSRRRSVLAAGGGNHYAPSR